MHDDVRKSKYEYLLSLFLIFIWLKWVLVAAHRVFIVSHRTFHCGADSPFVAHGLSSCSVWTWLLHAMWDLSSPTWI